MSTTKTGGGMLAATAAVAGAVAADTPEPPKLAGFIAVGALVGAAFGAGVMLGRPEE